VKKLNIAVERMQEGNLHMQIFENYRLYFYMQGRLKNGNPVGLLVDPTRKKIIKKSVMNESLWTPLSASKAHEFLYKDLNKRMMDKLQSMLPK
jgi:hypothetical protein